MIAREDMGSWLDGGPSGEGATPRGAGLGLPADGPGSPAGLGRRVVALTLDWALCLVIAGAFFDGDPMATLAVFAVENVLLVGTAGYTVGHRVLGLQVVAHVPPAAAPVPARGRPVAPVTGAGGADGAGGGDVVLPGPVRALVRTLLLCLVLPAVVRDADGRSLHDRAAGTVIVRR